MKIACVLITHLPMKAEQRRRPALRRHPAIIVEDAGSRQVVLDSSPEAAEVVAGMPLQEALSRCKDAVLLQADAPYYHQAFDAIVGALTQRSPLVEKGELGCAYVGLAGLEDMYGGEARLIAALLAAAPADFSARVGLAEGKFPAYVAAVLSEGGQATRVPDDVAGFLGKLPVDLLPLQWDTVARLRHFGLHTMGQIAALSVGSVQAQFGDEGRRTWDLANGIDRNPLVPYRSEEVVSEFLTFPAPATTLDSILPAVETLLGRAFARPSLRGKRVRTADVVSAVLSSPPWTRRFAFKEAVNGKARALFVLKNALATATLPGALEDMRLTLSGIAGESGIQTSLFLDVRRQEQLREMMRQLEVRLGRRPPIYRVRDMEPWSRIPERRQALVQFEP